MSPDLPPLRVTTYGRAWTWGLVIVADPNETDLLMGALTDASPVQANDKALCFGVRPSHAVEFPDGVEEVPFATADVVVELYEGDAPLKAQRDLIFDGAIETPASCLSVGDAEGGITVEAHRGHTRVRLTVGSDDDASEAHTVWMELLPVT